MRPLVLRPRITPGVLLSGGFALAAYDRAPSPSKKARLVPLARNRGFAIPCEASYQPLQYRRTPHSAADHCKSSGCACTLLHGSPWSLSLLLTLTLGTMNHQIDTLLSEQRRFPPPREFAARAAATEALYGAGRDWKHFWEEQARALEWISPWSQVLDWQLPHARWFVDGKLNASANCLDRHLAGSRRNKAAIIWEGEPGERRVFTYWDLAREVRRCANALRAL